eukprot:5263027-Pleurochrysis_carterae.AAC.1
MLLERASAPSDRRTCSFLKCLFIAAEGRFRTSESKITEETTLADIFKFVNSDLLGLWQTRITCKKVAASQDILVRAESVIEQLICPVYRE